MSTEHQQYSTQNQIAKIDEYASQRGLVIVKTYADEGKSGLRIGGRPSLQQLINDVQADAADFSTILVYDVSRWGRFQDADESAYYEYICRRAGIQVAYCAEQFENDGSPVSTIVKGVKRVMAGEYSRELSTKVFAGQCRLIELGFRQGGAAGYGLQRVLVDQFGTRKGELRRGEHKSLQTDRVILAPGRDHEIETVRKIYHWFVDDRLSEGAIAARLNAEGTSSEFRRGWTTGAVHRVLANEKYIGCNIFNRTSFKLGKLRVANPPDMWIRKDDAFAPVVDRDIFHAAQRIIRARAHQYSNDELIEQLRNLYKNRGYLSRLVIDEADGMASSSLYAERFGSLIRAYRMVGFSPRQDPRHLEINRFIRQFHPRLLASAEERMTQAGARVERDPVTDLLNVNHEFTVAIVVARCQQRASGCRWRVRIKASPRPDITVVVRLNHSNDGVRDYYLLPRIDFSQSRISLREQNAIELDSYRFESLDHLYGMSAQIGLKGVA